MSSSQVKNVLSYTCVCSFISDLAVGTVLFDFGDSMFHYSHQYRYCFPIVDPIEKVAAASNIVIMSAGEKSIGLWTIAFIVSPNNSTRINVHCVMTNEKCLNLC